MHNADDIDNTNQLAAWKDTEARDDSTFDHPAGEITLQKTRGQVARANALAGYIVGLAAFTPVAPTLKSYGS